jgi:predicted Ser/Thr protein kinase
MNQAVTFQATRPIIPAGTQLNGIYEIDEPIAAGGMGEIYKGHAIQTGDPVAIKLIRSDLAEAEAAFALFRKEAAALHNLYHEAIVRYYVFTVDPALGRPYLAMEYVDGQSLSTILRGGPLAYEAVLRLMQRIASGLYAAHERGIVHRDVSPDNIIIPAGDMARAKIIDFGIARSTRLGDEGTVIGSGFAGKYNYVSPEQLGLFGGEVTPKSDIYSLGLVLAEALRDGPIDMGGNHVEVVDKRRVVPDLEGIDPRLRPLIERMLQPNPADRPASMAEVAAWTADQSSNHSPARSARVPAGLHQSAGKGLGRWPLITGAGLGFLAAAAALFYGLTRAPPPQTAARPVPRLETGAPSAPAEAGPLPLTKLDLDPAGKDRLLVPGPAQRAKIEAIRTFLAQYDGGECFLLMPVSLAATSGMIEGYGQAMGPFRAFDEAFRHAEGFEADIGMRRVSSGQCAAVSFLSRIARAPPSPPVALSIAESSLKVGQALSGALSGLDGRKASLFLVGDKGTIRPVPVKAAGRDGGLSFSILAGPELGNEKLQLLAAVASPSGLASLDGHAPGPQEKIFADALAEAASTNQPVAVAVRSFKVAK